MAKVQEMMVKAQVAPKVGWGPTSTLGTLAALVAACGTVWAGIQGQDTATATGGALTGLAILATLGGRFAQAIVALRHVATVARPWIDAGLDALTDEDVEAAATGALPDDDEEFGGDDEVSPQAAEVAERVAPEARPVVDQPQA